MSQTGITTKAGKRGYTLEFKTVAGNDKYHDGLRLRILNSAGGVVNSKTVQVRTHGPVASRESKDYQTKVLYAWAQSII